MIPNDTKKVPKSSKNFCCEICDYNTSRKSQFTRHLSTQKHKNNENDTIDGNTFLKKVPKFLDVFKCECGKEYNQRQNLYRHKKNCNKIENQDKKGENQDKNNKNNKKKENREKNNKNNNYEINEILKTSNEKSKDLILKLVEENGEIKNMMFKQFETMQYQMHEQQKIMQNQISELIPRIGNNNTVTNKQKFNINIFLNEQCKDAITMEQFINKIQVTVDNLLVTKDKGLSEGVSNIFIENMKKLSLYERPMHCTDSKRETIYIKYEDNEDTNNGKWLKDDENEKLKAALNKVSHIQRKNLDKWIEDHPDWESKTDLQNEYIRLVKNCTEDIRENNNENKIIRKVCNEINLSSTYDED